MKLSERAKIDFKKKEPKPAPGPQPRLVQRASDGVIEARDGQGRLLAHFNPKTNETRDHRGELVGVGNRLPRLIQQAAATPSAGQPKPRL